MKHSIDRIYETMGEEESFFGGIYNRIAEEVHFLFCTACEQDANKLAKAQEDLQCNFFPDAPSIEDNIMETIDALEEDEPEAEGDAWFRGWIIAGVVILFSLSSVFFDINFQQIAFNQGSSFLLPIGLTIGLILSTYGAVFIGSHLKELSDHFGLRELD